MADETQLVEEVRKVLARHNVTWGLTGVACSSTPRSARRHPDRS